MTTSRHRDEDEDDWEDDEADLGDDSDDEPTVPCPYCRREILEDSPRCPYCERYISAEDLAQDLGRGSPKTPVGDRHGPGLPGNGGVQNTTTNCVWIAVPV